MAMNGPANPALAVVVSAETLQSFALQLAETGDQTTLESSLADDAHHRREQEKLDLQGYYAGTGSPHLEVQFLGNEKSELAKILSQLSPYDPNKVWTFRDFQTAVEVARKNWESKKRLGGGKAQAVFHKIMGKFKVHSNLFSLVPSANEYTSIICWAATCLVNASVQHTETVEELANVMEVVNEAAAQVEQESRLFRGPAVQQAVAKFYSAVFLLLGDVATWYSSNSLRKFRNSMHQGFDKQFKSGLENVQRLSTVVGRTTLLAAAAEGRVTRMTVKELRMDLQDQRAGMSGEMGRIAQVLMDQYAAHAQRLEEQSRLEHEETRRWVLAAVIHSMQHTEASFDKVAASGWDFLRENLKQITYEHTVDRTRVQLAYMQQYLPAINHGNSLVESINGSDVATNRTVVEVQKQVEKLLDYFYEGARTLQEPKEILPTATHERVALALELFLRSPNSTLLYLEYPIIAGTTPEISLVADRLVLSADEMKAPTISYFCRPCMGHEDNQSSSDSHNPLLGLLYSLTHQILSLVQPEKKIEVAFDLDTLDATLASWDSARDLFGQVLGLAPKLILIIIDSLDEIERDKEDEVGEVVTILRRFAGESSRTLKVLFTSTRRSFALLDKLQGDEINIVDTTSHRFGGGRGGRTPFIV
ncbi:uncharacterized protein PV06_00834 [Exophiala oligosperma]|uniref:Uncharacterized protein n=1 Tax=Exophiala oligosperma TaxID=215243 RepID=A0A0D2E096_9EURO|nr:uncharacterized protein PV06_00834 [Exophiala oligosperma]KIW48225.1 hypothetical protein PV06_00834 [Exophiala oligosperma]